MVSFLRHITYMSLVKSQVKTKCQKACAHPEGVVPKVWVFWSRVLREILPHYGTLSWWHVMEKCIFRICKAELRPLCIGSWKTPPLPRENSKIYSCISEPMINDALTLRDTFSFAFERGYSRLNIEIDYV